MSPAAFCATLLRWYAGYGRDLPWRHTRDPYAIWLSEVILQQTRISQGTAYWLRFMHAWPTVEALAAATEDEVLKMWQGLGYYSRARNLHTAAQQIVALGQFPCTLEEIRRLKGVGDYTAAAIASLAFGVTAAAVDGNVYRVLSRLYAIDTPINTTEGKHLFTRLANELIHAAPHTALSPQGEETSGASLEAEEDKNHHPTPYLYICSLPRLHRHSPSWLRRHLAGTVGAASLRRSVPASMARSSQAVGHLCEACFDPLLDTDVRPSLPEDYIWVPETQLGDYAVPRLVEKLVEMIA